MNGAYTLLGECLLLAFTLLASLTVFLIGRRVAYPASVAAYGAAVAALVADPLLSVANLHRVDRVVGIVGGVSSWSTWPLWCASAASCCCMCSRPSHGPSAITWLSAGRVS